MNQVVTKRDLAERGIEALDPAKQQQIAISRNAGGVSFASAQEVMDFAKLMSVADKAVPKHLRANPGACLRIVFQAVEWQMSPWAVADKSYEVNDRIAYESQLIHAVVEARALLSERLIAEYEGDGIERRVRIIGKFEDGTMRDIVTPRIKDIKVKNSPLWAADPDQQLFYYGSRSWARRWCPDVIMGLYTKEELRENPQLGRPDEDVIDHNPGLHARLASQPVDREEGHQEGHAEQQINGDEIVSQQPEEQQIASKRGRKKKAEAQPEQQAEQPPSEAEKAIEQAMPKNAKQWEAYCIAWIKAATDADQIRHRWKSEMKLRNDCGVTAEERNPVQQKMQARIEELE